MTLRVRRERFVVGLRGLALLRGWPFEDPVIADANLEAIAELLSEGGPSTVLQLDELDVRGAYASWAETYDDPNPLIEAEEPAVEGFLEGLEAGRALDVACGTGRLSRILVRAGHEVVGVDASVEMLSHARANVPGASLVLGDIRQLPISDANMDVVVCGLALTHVSTIREPIAEIARTLRPGGRLVISDIHPVAAATGAHAFFVRGDGTRGVTRNHVHWPSAYVDAFRSAGLVVDAVAEPLVGESFIEEMPEGEIRDAARGAIVGLPVALVWTVHKEG
jgi:ubiquinone/menaquinone biosynthesis C-methylase UbiE